MIPFTLPEHALPSMVWKDTKTSLEIEEIYSELLKPPSLRDSVVVVPSCIGIDDISRWIDHEYFSCIDNEDLVPVSALVAQPEQMYTQTQPHREKLDTMPIHKGTFGDEESLYQDMALVATPLRPKEWKTIAKAIDAVNKEYDELRSIDCWSESKVIEWADVKRDAQKRGVSVTRGRLFPICVVKHSESEKERKYKGRVCYQGNNVVDETGSLAVFAELGSSASLASGARVVDAYALMHGHKGEQSDAPKAYTQCPMLKGLPGYNEQESWVTLEPDQWPESWRGMKDPVCPLNRALYGHPLAGTYWEQFYTGVAVNKCGFLPVPGWECLFYHMQLRCLLSIYVDDFKVAGPAQKVDAVWKELRKYLKLDDPTPFGRYLGCNQNQINITPEQSRKYLENIIPVVFKEKLEGGMKWSDMTHKCPPIRAVEYDMREFMSSCVDKYCELTGTQERNLKTVTCPGVDDHQLKPENYEIAGGLSGDASKIIMKILYGARTCRWDLQQACNSLAREVSKWNKNCDIRLHKLVCWIKSSAEICLQGWIGDHIDQLRLVLYVDADFASDLRTSKSTSGAYVCLVGPQSFFPIVSLCKKQGCVSHSSTEAEIISLEHAMRNEALPLIALWDIVYYMCVGSGGTGNQGGSHNNKLFHQAGGFIPRFLRPSIRSNLKWRQRMYLVLLLIILISTLSVNFWLKSN